MLFLKNQVKQESNPKPNAQQLNSTRPETVPRRTNITLTRPEPNVVSLSGKIVLPETDFFYMQDSKILMYVFYNRLFSEKIVGNHFCFRDCMQCQWDCHFSLITAHYGHEKILTSQVEKRACRNSRSWAVAVHRGFPRSKRCRIILRMSWKR